MSAVEDVLISKVSPIGMSGAVGVSFRFLPLDVSDENGAPSAINSSTSELALTCEFPAVVFLASDSALAAMTTFMPEPSGLSILVAILMDILVTYVTDFIPSSISCFLLVVFSSSNTVVRPEAVNAEGPCAHVLPSSFRGSP